MTRFSDIESIQRLYEERSEELTNAYGDVMDMKKLSYKLCGVISNLQFYVDTERFRLEEKVSVADKDMVRLANSDADIDYLSDFITVKYDARYNLKTLEDYHQQVLTNFFKAREADAGVIVVEINLKLAKTPEQVEKNVAKGYEARRDRIDRLYLLHQSILNLKRLLKLIPE